MKSQFVIICILFGGSHAFAQVIITTQDVQNVYHSQSPIVLDSGNLTGILHIGKPDSKPQIFDFSGVSFKPDSLCDTIVASASTPYQDSFPGCQLALKIPYQIGSTTLNAFAYFGFDSTGFLANGVYSPLGSIRPTPAELQVKTPLTYGTTWSYVSDTSEYILGDHQLITIINSADAYGTVIVGADSFPCVRVRTYDSTVTFSSGGLSKTSVNYQYYFYMPDGNVVRIGVDSANGNSEMINPQYFIYAHHANAPVVQCQGSLSFGMKQMNTSPRIRTIQLQNTGYGSAHLLNFGVQGMNANAFSINAPQNGIILGEGNSQSFAISFIPHDTGAMNATLTFTADDSTQQHSVSLFGIGIDSPLLYPQQICFASTRGDDSTFEVCNGTEDTLIAGSISFGASVNPEFSLGAISTSDTIFPGDCLFIEVTAEQTTMHDTALLSVQTQTTTAEITLTTNCGNASGVIESIPRDESLIHHYPDPFTSRTTFVAASAGQFAAYSRLQIFDMLGRCVANYSLAQLSGNEIIVDGSNFSPGAYNFRFMEGSKSLGGMMVHIR